MPYMRKGYGRLMLPYLKVYTVARTSALTGKFGAIAEAPIVAEDDKDAKRILRGHFLLVEYGQGYEADDILVLKAPDASIILTTTLAELIR